MRWFAVIFRNSDLNWSPAPILTGSPCIRVRALRAQCAPCGHWGSASSTLRSSLNSPVGVRRARAILGSAEVERNADKPASANPLYLPRNDLVERSKTVPVSANPLPLGAGIAIKVGDEVV